MVAASQSKTAVTFSTRPTPQHGLPAATTSPTNLSELQPVLKPGTALPATLTGRSESSVAIPPSSQPRHRGGSVSRNPSLCSSSSLKLCPEFAAIQCVLRLHVVLLLLLPPHVQALPLGGLEPSGRPRGWTSFSQEAAGSGRPFPLFSPIHQRNRDGSDRLHMGFFFPGRLGSQS